MRRSTTTCALLLALAACGGGETTAPAASSGEAGSASRVERLTTGVREVAFETSLMVPPGDRKITVLSYKTPVASTNQFNRPEPGKILAAIDVQECAGPAGEKFGPESPGRFDWQLMLPDGSLEGPVFADVQQPQLVAKPLKGGDCMRGWVTFEVPASGTPRFVVYENSGFSARWRIP